MNQQKSWVGDLVSGVVGSTPIGGVINLVGGLLGGGNNDAPPPPPPPPAPPSTGRFLDANAGTTEVPWYVWAMGAALLFLLLGNRKMRI